MKRMVKTIAVLVALTTAESVVANTGSADHYPNYYAAKRAQDRNDCDTTVYYLNALLRKHPYVRERYPEFYEELELVMGQCTGTIKVRGIEGESSGIDPLPDVLPMEE